MNTVQIKMKKNQVFKIFYIYSHTETLIKAEIRNIYLQSLATQPSAPLEINFISQKFNNHQYFTKNLLIKIKNFSPDIFFSLVQCSCL